jgi:hypothetical protein
VAVEHLPDVLVAADLAGQTLQGSFFQCQRFRIGLGVGFGLKLCLLLG